ncbi:membrane protein [Salmonella enterica subsp. enterica serovar Enteritidis]|nr:membrane protein [Salmonella enterica subsp. enterica serovar Enteritidis]
MKKKADEQPVAQSADSSASNTQSTSAESADANDVLNQKLNVYIDCYNNLQAGIYRAVNRYANTFDDFRTGPTGKEDDPSPLVPVYPALIQDCRKDIKAAAELKPAFASLDSAALAFINAAGPLAETINSMNKYYDQDNFKDDAFAGAKAFHKTFIKQFDEFDPIARRDYHYEWAACG